MYSYLLGAILGLVLGSLIKCLADRATTQESFFSRSRCDSCQTTLKVQNLIPVISYLVQKGRCTKCGHKIGISYPLVEIISAVIFSVLIGVSLPDATFQASHWLLWIIPILNTCFYVFITVVLLIVLLTDLETGLIPNRITYPAIVIALIFQITISLTKVGVLYFSLKDHLLGKYLLPPNSDYFYRHSLEAFYPLLEGLAAAALLGGFFYLLIIFTKGKGMGGGDFKLSIFIGLCLGLYLSVAALMIAFLLGSIVGIGLILIRKKSFGQTIPFGPFLSIGAISALLWGQSLINWYLNISFG